MTQREFAKMLSVSQATVSMALNGNPAISEAVRKRIRKMADQVGYRPNLAGQLLRKGRNNMLGVILPSLHHGFYADLLAELHRAAEEKGHLLLLENCDDQDRFEHAVAAMKRFNVAGIMAVCGGSWLLELEALHVPVVLLQGTKEPADLSSYFSMVYPDMEQCGQDLAGYLLKQGRKHPLFLGRINEKERRYAAFSSVFSAAGICCNWLPGSRNTAEDGYRLTDEMFRLFPETDAVAVHSDNMAVGVLRRLWELRVPVPSRIAVAGFDNIRNDSYTTPTLTSIGPDCRSFADAAVAELLTAIKTPGYHREVRIPCALTVRESS